MKEVETNRPSSDPKEMHRVGHIGVGGERGIVFETNGISPCLSATQYKDATKVVVNDSGYIK